MLQKIWKFFYIVSLALIGTMHISCDHTKVGYLETQNAIYIPDSMVVKAILDPQEDSERIEFKIPWQSTSIEGIQGTMPIYYSIRSIVYENPRPEISEQFRMVRKGVIELPYDHTVPPGTYIINIRVSNEGYVYNIDSIYKVIVE